MSIKLSYYYILPVKRPGIDAAVITQDKPFTYIFQYFLCLPFFNHFFIIVVFIVVIYLFFFSVNPIKHEL